MATEEQVKRFYWNFELANDENGRGWGPFRHARGAGRDDEEY